MRSDLRQLKVYNFSFYDCNVRVDYDVKDQYHSFYSDMTA